MERAFKIGCHVVYFDSYRQPHDAIVTNWFHGGADGQTFAEFKEKHDAQNKTNSEYKNPLWLPCCNLLFVSDDKTKTDSYGRQTEHQTSVGYGRQGMTPFLGCCWAWPDEREEAVKLASEAYDKAVAK
jgi:hypothetical protein